jgi:hypothetical protein
MDDFEIYCGTIENLQSVREFEIWLTATDDAIEITNIDPLIEYLLEINKPEFVLKALEFKQLYL